MAKKTKKRKLTKAHIAKMQAGRKKASRKGRKTSKKLKCAKVLGTIHGVTVLAKVEK